MLDEFKFQQAFVDAGRLSRCGITWPCIFRLSSLAVRFCQDKLIISLPISGDRKEYDEISGYADVLYWQCSLMAARIRHPTLSVQVVFCTNIPLGSVAEFIPQGIPVDSNVSREQFPVPGSLAVPLMAMEIPMISYPTFERVLFAGTFDHLHAGHKSVLTRSLFMTRGILYIGFASEELLQRKSCPQALETLNIRKRNVSDFITAIMPDCLSRVQLVMLDTHDAVGPAATLAFDALVVTPETLAGGALVNSARKAHGCKEVEIVSISLLGNADVSSKLSSTGVRELLCEGLPNGAADLDYLHASWLKLNESLGTPKSTTTDWWCRLRDLQGLQPWRAYHTLRHVEELLQLADSNLTASPPVEVSLSIWFHDAIYVPRTSTNEEDSVALFNDFAIEANLSRPCKEAVTQAILLTKSHRLALADSNTEYPAWMKEFLELDLSILGAPGPRYVEYSRQIKAEYPHISDDQFINGRTAFLESMTGFRFKYLKSSSLLNDMLETNLASERERFI